MNIEYTSIPSNQDIDFLTQKLNQENPDFGASYPFAFFIRDEKGAIIAGCNGSVVFGAIYTDQLWVHQDYRKTGLGQELMKRVHDKGREVGCTMATLTTLTFQNAVEFYEKLGYAVDFERSGYIKGSRALFLKKIL